MDDAMNHIIFFIAIYGGFLLIVNVAAWILKPIIGGAIDYSDVTIGVGHRDPRNDEFHGSVFTHNQSQPVVITSDSCPTCIRNKANDLARLQNGDWDEWDDLIKTRPVLGSVLSTFVQPTQLTDKQHTQGEPCESSN